MPDKASYVKVLIAFDPPQIPPRIAPPRRVDSVESEKVAYFHFKQTTADYYSDRSRFYLNLIRGPKRAV